MSEKLWEGRFAEKTDKLVETFTSSIDVDKRLYKYDIEGSIAHCRMMAKQSIISDKEAKEIIKGLEQVETEIKNNQFTYSDSLEDIHMHIENRLTEILGDVAKKLHTARSRNDQIALDLRMYLRDECNIIMESLSKLKKIFVELSRKYIDIPVAGYTHLQRAQPILFSHHLMAYYEMFKRDCERFQDAMNRINVMPLGAAALAGTTYPIDRDYVAKVLDFPSISKNSMDTVADRDFIIEFISNASICMIHFSRLSEEIILWSTTEYSFIEISDAFTTGSSIMPQKKNPDVAEIVRGKTGRVVGNLISIITLMKSLPLTYNRDMQEDKPPLFDTVDTLKACISLYIKMMPHIKINKGNMKKSVSEGFLNATDLADYLVTKGMAFREAHSTSGKTVTYAIAQKKEIQELSVDELKKFSNLIKKDIFKFLTTEQMIARRISFGGTAGKNVMAAIKEAEKDI